jgi:hypothetical protein
MFVCAQDPRFNHDVDAKTGYVTKALLCMPIKDYSGSVLGVAQVINKLDGEEFTQNDEQVFSSYLQFCGIGLRNARLYERSQLEIKRNQVALILCYLFIYADLALGRTQFFFLLTPVFFSFRKVQVLLDLARVIFEEQSTIEHIVHRIMTHLMSLLQCCRCQVRILQEKIYGNPSVA